jgi:hypothetical protein
VFKHFLMSDDLGNLETFSNSLNIRRFKDSLVVWTHLRLGIIWWPAPMDVFQHFELSWPPERLSAFSVDLNISSISTWTAQMEDSLITWTPGRFKHYCSWWPVRCTYSVHTNIVYNFVVTTHGCLSAREDWILRGPQSASFWVPRYLSHHMIRQARTGDTL